MFDNLLNAGKNLVNAGADALAAGTNNLSQRINKMSDKIKENGNTISLSKGVNISLEKEITENGMKKVCIGLAWDEIPGASDFDADTVVVMLDENSKIVNDGAVYYRLAPASGKPFNSADGSVHHSGDNLTGKGSGDDETVTIDLTAVPAHVAKLDIIVNIHDASARGQNFGQVPSCKARAYNQESGAVLAKYDLVEDFSGATAVLAVQLYRYENTWKFKAIGAPLTGNLIQIVDKYK